VRELPQHLLALGLLPNECPVSGRPRRVPGLPV